MIIAVQNLKSMDAGGGKLARLTIIWYVGTTILAIVISTILVDLVWRPMMTVADPDSLQMSEEDAADVEEKGGMAAHDVVVQVFESFIPNNVVGAVANDELLAVLVSAIVVGCLIKGPDSSILRAVREVEKIVMTVITFLIKLAPIGVFFLILSNLFTLDIEDIGQNLGVLVGGSIVNMASKSCIPPPETRHPLSNTDFPPKSTSSSSTQSSSSPSCAKTPTPSGSAARAPGSPPGPPPPPRPPCP